MSVGYFFARSSNRLVSTEWRCSVPFWSFWTEEQYRLVATVVFVPTASKSLKSPVHLSPLFQLVCVEHMTWMQYFLEKPWWKWMRRLFKEQTFSFPPPTRFPGRDVGFLRMESTSCLRLESKWKSFRATRRTLYSLYFAPIASTMQNGLPIQHGSSVSFEETTRSR